MDDHDSRASADLTRWPATRAELTRADLCPACFRPLSSSICRTCGLDLTHPAATDLLAVSLAAAAQLDRRRDLISRIRSEPGGAPPRSSDVASEVSAVAGADARPPVIRKGAVAAASPIAAAASSPPGRALLPPDPVRARIPSPAPRRWSSVQLILLIVGVSLLSIGAVAFLVYAFVVYGIVWRTVIIGAVTVASFTTANLLHRRSLRATAEGIAAFSVVLVYLDASAVRGNDFFGAGSIDADVYRGATVALSAIGLLLWHRLSGLLLPRVVGVVSFAPGVGTLVYGLSRMPDESVRLWLALCATAAAAATLRLVERAVNSGASAVSALRADLPHSVPWDDGPSDAVPMGTVSRAVALSERHLVAGTALAALVFAGLVAVTLESTPAGVAAVLATTVVAGIAAVHVVLLRPRAAGGVARSEAGSGPQTGARLAPGRAGRLWGSAFAAVSALALSTAGFTVASHAASITPFVIVPALGAVVVALAFDALTSRASDPYLRAVAVSAVRTAGITAMIAAAIPSAVVVGATAGALERALTLAWTMRPGDTILDVGEELAWSVATLVVMALLVGAAAFMARRSGDPVPPGEPAGFLRSDGSLVILAWFSTGVIFFSVPLLGVLWAMILAWFAVAAAALIALIAPIRSRPTDHVPVLRLRPPAAILFAGAIAAGALLSWASTSTWPIAAAATIALALVARRAVATVWYRAGLLGVAVATAIGSAAAAARQLAFPQGPPLLWVPDPLRSSEVAAIVLLAGAAIVTARRRSSRHPDASSPVPPASSARAGGREDACVVFWIGLAAVVHAEVALEILRRVLPSTDLVAGPPLLLLHSALVVALLLWALLPATAAGRTVRAAASLALGPAVYLVVTSLIDTIGATDLTRSVAPMTAALATSVASLVVARVRSDSAITRSFREIGVAIVAVPALVSAGVAGGPSLWLVLLLAAVTAWMLACGPDTPLFAESPRRLLAAGALVLPVVALGARVAGGPIRSVELFSLPLAGTLLLVALVVWRASRRKGHADASGKLASAYDPVPPSITSAGLLVALLPTAMNAVTGGAAPAIVVGALSAGLFLLGCLGRTGGGLRPYLDAAALAGGAGVLVVALGRAAVLSGTRPASAELDGWVASALLVVFVAAIGLTALPDTPSFVRRGTAARFLALPTLTAAFLIETVALTGADSPPLRAITVVLGFAVLHVSAFVVDRAPFDRVFAWAAVGFAAATAATAVGAGLLDPIETATVPVAVALLITGAVQLQRDRRSRSWPWLGPGTGVLLLPSLIAAIDDRPLWRLVALGIVGVVTLAVAAVRRLQAPFVIASAVLLMHAIWSFLPQLQAIYESVAWWLWLVVGGAVLIALAARFESRVRDLKDIAARIGSLR